MPKKPKSLLPKRIGNVKIGKSVRKGALADILASRAGQALIAEAILAAGAVAGAGIIRANDARKARKAGKADRASPLAAPRATASKASDEASAAADTLTYALGEAVRSFSAALHSKAADRTAWTPLEPKPIPRRTRARRPTAPVSPPT